MKKLYILFAIVFLFSASNSFGQCAMCKRTAETNFESKHKQVAAKSLNHGIIYLLSVPYIIGAVGAFAWYHNRKKGS